MNWPNHLEGSWGHRSRNGSQCELQAKERKGESNSRGSQQAECEKQDTAKGEDLSGGHDSEGRVMASVLYCSPLFWRCLKFVKGSGALQGWTITPVNLKSPSGCSSLLQHVPSSTSIIIALLSTQLEGNFGYVPLECFFNIRSQVLGCQWISQNAISVARTKDNIKMSKRIISALGAIFSTVRILLKTILGERIVFHRT